MKKLVSTLAIVWLSAIVAAAAPNVAKLSSKCNAGDAKACAGLAKLATTQKKWEVRAASAAALKDPDVLTQVATTDGRIEVRRAALRNPALGEKAHELAPFYDPEATKAVDDQDLLERIVRTKTAITDVEGGPRDTALRAIRERERLEAIAADASIEGYVRHKADQRLLALEPHEAAVLLVSDFLGDLTKGCWPPGCANSESIALWGFRQPGGEFAFPSPLQEGAPVGQLFLRPGGYDVVVALSTLYEGREISAGATIRFTVKANHSYCIAGGTISTSDTLWQPQVMEMPDVAEPGIATPIVLDLVTPNSFAATQANRGAPATWVPPEADTPEGKPCAWENRP